jgi:hypothetical protein
MDRSGPSLIYRHPSVGGVAVFLFGISSVFIYENFKLVFVECWDGEEKIPNLYR